MEATWSKRPSLVVQPKERKRGEETREGEQGTPALPQTVADADIPSRRDNRGKGESIELFKSISATQRDHSVQ